MSCWHNSSRQYFHCKGTVAGSDITTTSICEITSVEAFARRLAYRCPRGPNNDTSYTDSGVTTVRGPRRGRSPSTRPMHTRRAHRKRRFYRWRACYRCVCRDASAHGQAGRPCHAAGRRRVTYRTSLTKSRAGWSKPSRGAIKRSVVTRCCRSFNLSRTPAIPPSGLISAGLAGTIVVAPSVDQSVWRQSESAQGRRHLRQTRRMSTTQPAPPASSIAYSNWPMASPQVAHLIRQPWESQMRNLIDFAGSSTSWLESQRKSANDGAT